MRLHHAAVLALLAAPAGAAEFAILIYEPAAEHALRAQDGPETAAYWAAYGGWSADMADAGVVRAGAPVDGAASARTLGADETPTTAARGVELGGFFVIEAADMAAAEAWAARSPALSRGGAVEIRPVAARPAT